LLNKIQDLNLFLHLKEEDHYKDFHLWNFQMMKI